MALPWDIQNKKAFSFREASPHEPPTSGNRRGWDKKGRGAGELGKEGRDWRKRRDRRDGMRKKNREGMRRGKGDLASRSFLKVGVYGQWYR